jgi:DNA primase
VPLNDDFKSQVLAATDIVDLIGQSVALKRRGKDFVGLCPFHQEKTPSFHVSPAKQFFRCFGCKAGGNVIDFIIKRDHLDFLDALKFLAERAGIEIPKYGISKQKTGERQLLLDAHSASCAVFEKILASEAGRLAREYLQQRGFTADSIQKFQIGFAPESWDTLLRAEAMRKFPPSLLATAGLVKPRNTGSGFYDTFRNRVMFPIRDEASRVIAFGGRVMPGGDSSAGPEQAIAKYLNSPETPLFSKSRSIFGIDLARQKIVETRTVAIVEGYTDVVIPHQFGCSNVVAALGTALTEQHINLLKRFADRIVLLFDADVAGDTAVDRAVSLFLAHPIDIQIASIPEGLDPDEFLLKYGADRFNELLRNATDALSYKWKQLVARFRQDPNDFTGQQKAVDEYLSTIAGARSTGPIDSLRWGAILARVSKLTDIPAEQLNLRFKPKRPSNVAKPRAAAMPPVHSAPITALDRAERQILGLLLLYPDHWTELQQHIAPEDFTHEARRRLAELCWDHHRHEGSPVLSEFLSTLNEANLDELALELVEECKTILDTNVANALRQAIEYIGRAARERTGHAVAKALPATVVAGNEEIDGLRKLTELASQRKKNV